MYLAQLFKGKILKQLSDFIPFECLARVEFKETGTFLRHGAGPGTHCGPSINSYGHSPVLRNPCCGYMQVRNLFGKVVFYIVFSSTNARIYAGKKMTFYVQSKKTFMYPITCRTVRKHPEK